MKKKWKVRLKWVQTKQGLRISHLLAFTVRALRWRKGDEKKRRRRRKKIRRRNSSLEFLFGTLVFVCMEPMYGFVG